ncbi:MAG: type II toxin-antitoxin system VapC family toxin [Bacteroidetes bacterium]|nr:type II toxin-antitoxin system VapC family toxin [Bacteroidota bacterium]
MKTIAVDTNIAIDILNGNEKVISMLDIYSVLCIPVTVCGELLFGAVNSGNSKRNLVKYRGFISNCTILNINTDVAEQYAVIRKNLKKRGTPIPENDIWIAATCIVYDILLATNDRHFSYISSLNLF